MYMKSCDTCYRRKVKCDSVDRANCSNCKKRGGECTFELAKIKSRPSARPRKYRKIEDDFSSSLAVTLEPSIGGETSNATASTSTSPLNDPLNGPTTKERNGKGKGKADNSRQHRYRGHTNTSKLSVQNLIFTEEEVAEQGISRHELVRFFEPGGSWTDRTVYVGSDGCNMSVLVEQELDPIHQSQIYPTVNYRTKLPWKPTSNMPLAKWNPIIAQESTMLPTKNIRDDLVDSYFRYVHPGFPIINESMFRKQYADPEHPPPLLLLQSILLVGSHVSKHPKIVESRSLVKLAFFHRAKALFDVKYENDRVMMIQAALLFMWQFEGTDDVCANGYYWLGIACRMAFGLGLHRDPSDTLMPIEDLRAWKRIWWVLFYSEVHLALSHGRPVMINPNDYDTPHLTIDDFRERDLDNNVAQNIDFDYVVNNSSLAEIMLQVIGLFPTRKLPEEGARFLIKRNQLDAQLASWYIQLPQRFKDMNSLDIWGCLLNLNYNCVLLHIHRRPFPKRLPPSSSDICSSAASNITKVFEQIVQLDSLRSCSYQSLTASFAAALEFTTEARQAEVNNPVLTLHALSRLKGLLNITKMLAAYWPTASALHRLFSAFHERLENRANAAISAAASSNTNQTYAEAVTELEQPCTDSKLDATWANLFRLPSAEINDWSNFERWLATNVDNTVM